jgi:hypothetical protein
LVCRSALVVVLEEILMALRLVPLRTVAVLPMLISVHLALEPALVLLAVRHVGPFEGDSLLL